MKEHQSAEAAAAEEEGGEEKKEDEEAGEEVRSCLVDTNREGKQELKRKKRIRLKAGNRVI